MGYNITVTWDPIAKETKSHHVVNLAPLSNVLDTERLESGFGSYFRDNEIYVDADDLGGSFGFAYKSGRFPPSFESIHHLKPCHWNLSANHTPSIYDCFSPLPDKMKHRFLSIALFTLYLPHLITAQCSACDSYSAALKSCQTTSANITEVGNTMDTKSVHCMCVSSSSASEMNACQGCDESNINLNLDDVLLLTWYQTCKADSQWGDQQAIACWEGQPINLLPCIENTGGKGSGTTPGGSGLTTGSASR